MKNRYIYTAVSVFVLFLLAAIIYGNIQSQGLKKNIKKDVFTGIEQKQDKPSYTVEVLPSDSYGPSPSLMVVYGKDFDKKSVAEKDMIVSKIKDINSALGTEPGNGAYWLELGIYRKMAGDFNGALEVWNYASRILSNNVPVQLNIAELYAYDIKDLAKAEETYKKAISNNPAYFQVYLNTFDFYRSIYPKTDKAEKILLEGIAATKGNLNLITSLASYYKYNERWSDAIVYYQKALDIAVSLKRADMQGSFQAEIDELRAKIK